jgi:hypothetical protein
MFRELLAMYCAEGMLLRARHYAALTAVILAACSAGPPPKATVSHVDPVTAVTVRAMSAPVEFTSESGGLDVAIGPVEIDEMGTRTYFLWVSVLGEGEKLAPTVRLLDGQQVLLERDASSALVQAPVSAAPYTPLAPWAPQFYYPITVADLRSLEGRPLGIELTGRKAVVGRLAPWTEQPRNFDSFIKLLPAESGSN